MSRGREREREGFPRNNASSIGTITTDRTASIYTNSRKFRIMGYFNKILLIDDPFRAEEIEQLDPSLARMIRDHWEWLPINHANDYNYNIRMTE